MITDKLIEAKDENGLINYYLDTGLWRTQCGQKFKNDRDAWEKLRKQLPNKFATLYKEYKVACDVVNINHYVACNNEKYVDKIDLDGKDYLEELVDIPVLMGITSDEYDKQI